MSWMRVCKVAGDEPTVTQYADTDPDAAWHEEADVVVVGYGYAGAVAAIEAHDAGADVLLIEKMPDPGGISITSGGNVRIVEDAEEGFRHLQATNAGTTPDCVLRALAAGMQEIPDYFEKLARACGAAVDRRQADGNYPFAGTKTFGYVVSSMSRTSMPNAATRSSRATFPFIAPRGCACSRCSTTTYARGGCGSCLQRRRAG